MEEKGHENGSSNGDANGDANGGGGCPFFKGKSTASSSKKDGTESLPSPTYNSYLKVDDLLACQQPLSELYSSPSTVASASNGSSHHEMLFIIVHQVYELWFKQILHELDSCIEFFRKETLPARDLLQVVSRLRRITKIQDILVAQFTVVETLSPQDFMEFRDLLGSSSGFQSAQFRMLENKLGLDPDARMKHGGKTYDESLPSEKAAQCKSVEFPSGSTLFECVQDWLERTPFVTYKKYDFFAEYQNAVDRMFEAEREAIESNPDLSDDDKEEQIANEVEPGVEHFQSLFSEEKHNALRNQKRRRFSHAAMKAALLISLHCDEPLFQMPFQLLQLLQEIDINMTAWRDRHASMVLRIIGNKIGTGGSSGHNYLKATSLYHKVFMDLFNLSGFVISRSLLPPLPAEIVKDLQFRLHHGPTRS